MPFRIAVVTGANRGLGLATVEALADKHYTVVLAARNSAKAELAVDSIRKSGRDLHPAVIDVSSSESVDAFFAHHMDYFGQIDVLVNNAGAIFEGDESPEGQSALGIGEDIVRRAFETNAMGAFRMTQRALPLMNAAKFGRVVNVSSGMGALTDSGSGHAAYRVSKTAMNSMTRLFHNEAGQNVKVNSVCPGWVRTEMGGPNATRSLDEGIRGIVWAATLDDDGPSGGFYRDGKPIEW